MELYDKNKKPVNKKNLLKGPLGLLALGDVGVRLWNEAKKEISKNS